MKVIVVPLGPCQFDAGMAQVRGEITRTAQDEGWAYTNLRLIALCNDQDLAGA